MKLYDWLLTVATALNDDRPSAPFARYKMRDMLAAYNAAMCLVSTYRPDLFTELRVVKLEPGIYQDVRGCCANVLDVQAQVLANGDVVKKLQGSRERSTVVKRRWKKPSCARAGEDGLPAFLIDYATLDKNLGGRFEVEPAVPCGVEAWVLVKCVNSPCPATEADALLGEEIDGDCVHNVAAWHYVLARMLTGDRFSNAASQDGQYHYRMFFDLLGIAQRQEEKFESPEEA